MKNEIINQLKEFEEGYNELFVGDTWADIEISDAYKYGFGVFCHIQEMEDSVGIYEVAVYRNYIDENGSLTSDWTRTVVPIFCINKDFEEVL